MPFETLNKEEDTNQQIQTLRNDLTQLEKDPVYSTTIDRVNKDGVQENYSSEEEREKDILMTEDKIRDLEKKNQALKISEEISILQSSIIECEKAIKSIEAGETHKVVLEKDVSGASYNTIDELHEKINIYEKQLMDLENKRNQLLNSGKAQIKNTNSDVVSTSSEILEEVSVKNPTEIKDTPDAEESDEMGHALLKLDEAQLHFDQEKMKYLEEQKKANFTVKIGKMFNKLRLWGKQEEVLPESLIDATNKLKEAEDYYYDLLEKSKRN